MKERIVIPKDKIKVLTSCGHFPANVYFTFNKDDAKIEQVPETFEELKELCKDLERKNVFITCGGECIEFNGLSFWQDGRISHDADQSMYAIKIDVTPARQWNIIKSLIGEE